MEQIKSILCDSYGLKVEERGGNLYGNDRLERLSGDYNRGYTRAIQDIIEIFEYIQMDLEHHHKRMNQKLAIQLLNTILKERAKIRDFSGGFIRFNGQLNGFEYFKRGER